LQISGSMATTQPKFETVDQYIASFPEDIQQTLQMIRTTLKQAAPEAREVIHYQMPALDYHGKMIYFAAFKNHYHITLPHPANVFEVFKDELSKLSISKSTITLPKDKPIPLDLLNMIVKFRVKEFEQ